MKVTSGSPLENVAVIKQSALLKYFTDGFTDFRLEIKEVWFTYTRKLMLTAGGRC